MNAGLPKQFLPVAGREMLVRTAELFAECLPGSPLVIVVPQAYAECWERLAAKHSLSGRCITAYGGASRTQSVRNGLAAMPPCDIIGIHDGARPLATPELIRRCFETAREKGSAIPVTEPADSFRAECDGRLHPIDRKRLRAVQTPQVFFGDALRDAYARTEGDFSDDASVMEQAGYGLAFCEGEPGNIKVTVEADLEYAEYSFAKREGHRTLQP